MHLHEEFRTKKKENEEKSRENLWNVDTWTRMPSDFAQCSTRKKNGRKKWAEEKNQANNWNEFRTTLSISTLCLDCLKHKQIENTHSVYCTHMCYSKIGIGFSLHVSYPNHIVFLKFKMAMTDEQILFSIHYVLISSIFLKLKKSNTFQLSS